MTEREYIYLRHRLRYLPDQILAARRKLKALEREAARLGVEVPPCADV